MEDAKEEVRARLNIEDVIGEYIPLKRAGRSFKGLSPFTSEKTPSFYVSPDKQIWHDFSSGKGGDVFSFVMEVEGLDFRGSLDLLARKAGVDLDLYKTSGQGVAKERKRLLSATELALNYYQQSLIKNQHALDYVLKKRELSKEIIQEFKLGYAPTQGRALTNFLKKRGFTNFELNRAGLANRYETDLFRGRIIIPLLDETGQAIGFTGRILEDSDVNAPKYLNTPATLLYDKSRHIFGLSQAKESIRKAGYSVIVEGNLDVISSHQAGVKMVVATAGTALTEMQLKTLKRLSEFVKLAFDGDKAGIAAMERTIPLASGLDINLQVVELPEGVKDPDELIKRDVKYWQVAIESSESAIDWLINKYEARFDLRTADGKRKFSTASISLIETLQDPVEKDHYYKLVASRIGTVPSVLLSKQQAGVKNIRTYKLVKPHDSKQTEQLIYTHIDTVIGAGIVHPNLRGLFIDLPDLFELTSPRQVVINFLKVQTGPIDLELSDELQKVTDYAKIAVLRAENRYDGWSEDIILQEVITILRQYKNESQKQNLIKQIQLAESHADEVLLEKLQKDYYELIKEIKRGR